MRAAQCGRHSPECLSNVVVLHGRRIHLDPPPFFVFFSLFFFWRIFCCWCQVYKAVNRATKEPVAIKVMTKARLGERALHMLAAEINILRTLEHRESYFTRFLTTLLCCNCCTCTTFIGCGGMVLPTNCLLLWYFYQYNVYELIARPAT